MHYLWLSSEGPTLILSIYLFMYFTFFIKDCVFNIGFVWLFKDILSESIYYRVSRRPSEGRRREKG